MIGDLNKRITLQAPTRISDGMGGYVNAWIDIATVYAAIWPISANDVIQANSSTMLVTHRIRVRYRSVLKTAWRVKFGGNFYTIVSILNPNMARKHLDLLCKEAA